MQAFCVGKKINQRSNQGDAGEDLNRDLYLGLVNHCMPPYRTPNGGDQKGPEQNFPHKKIPCSRD